MLLKYITISKLHFIMLRISLDIIVCNILIICNDFITLKKHKGAYYNESCKN